MYRIMLFRSFIPFLYHSFKGTKGGHQSNSDTKPYADICSEIAKKNNEVTFVDLYNDMLQQTVRSTTNN